MGLKIDKRETVNRTFRLDKKIVDRLCEICNEKNISLNKVVEICLEYALDNLEEDNKS